MELNLLAPINSLGYGVVGTNVAVALHKLHHEVALWPIGHVECDPDKVDALRSMIGRQAEYNPFAPSLRIWHQFDLAQHVGQKLHAALPIFELDRFKPNELHHLQMQDRVFATSRWAAGVLEQNGVQQKNIAIARLGVDPDIFRPAPPEGKAPNTTVFLNMGKWEVRKGHDVLVEAFGKAFEQKDDVALVMHCFNPCFADPERGASYNAQWVRLYQNSRLAGKIRLVTERLGGHRAVAGLMARADCGVFPSRGEGWNLEAGEMLAMGKHLIITDCGAHAEFCTPGNSLLVNVPDKEEAHDGVWFNADDPAWSSRPGRWGRIGQEQVDQLVEHLRAVHRLKQSGGLGHNAAGIETMRQFTWENTAHELIAGL